MNIEEQTGEILNKYGGGNLPINVLEIAKKANVLVKYAPSTKFSGLLYRKDSNAFMAISSSESNVRQRFTIAHELGHFFLHPQKDTFVEFRDNEKNIARGVKEIQANKFAAALLMPRKLLEKDIKSFKNTDLTKTVISFLAEKYNVSEEAMTFRLMNLNLTTAV